MQAYTNLSNLWFLNLTKEGREDWERSVIDGRLGALPGVRRQQRGIELIAVIAAIADQSRREIREEAGLEGGGDEVWLIR